MDRNVIGDVMGKALAVALRKESVDRNFQTTTLNRYDIVALRKESVDRNLVHIRDRQLGALSLSARRAWIEIRYVDPVPVNYKMSLSARRAWIEISSVWCTCLRAPVALRKESVDRNTALLKSVKSMSRRSPQGERG